MRRRRRSEGHGGPRSGGARDAPAWRAVRRPLGALIVLLLVAAYIGGAVVVRERPRAPDLCVPSTAFAEWRSVARTTAYSPERYDIARPVAHALARCRRPLLGLTRAQVEARLTGPDRGYESDLWVYDLGTLEQGSIGPGMNVAFAADGRVRSVTAPPRPR